MKHFNRNLFMLLPLLTVLSATPDMLMSHSGRFIASVEEVRHPKLEELASKVDKKTITKELNLDSSKFIEKRNELVGKITVLKESKDIDKKEKVEEILAHLLLVEDGFKELKDKKGLNEAQIAESEVFILESRDALEDALALPKEEKKVEVASKEEVKEEKKEIAEEKKSDSEKLICELEEKNKALTKQVEELIADQKRVMETFMGMAQMMVAMNQQSQMFQQYQFQNSMSLQTPYQYAQQSTAGNWVYYPQGFGPTQSNIFSGGNQQAPSVPSAPSNGWDLKPQMSFEAPMAQSFQMPGQPSQGQFPMNGLSYNFAPQGPSFSAGNFASL